jgi:hypothetical protein
VVAFTVLPLRAGGIRFTSSRAMRQAAWMIQEIDRSWRSASFWVSASMAELK